MDLNHYHQVRRWKWATQCVMSIGLIAILVAVAGRVHSNVTTIDSAVNESELKASLISHMHQEMLNISGLQLQLIHARNKQHAMEILSVIASHIHTFNNQFHAFETMANSHDQIVLDRLKSNFQSWRDWTKTLTDFAFLVSDQDMVNFLSMTSLSMAQLDAVPSTQIARND